MTRVLYCGRADHPQAALAKRQMSGFGQVVTFELAGGKEAAFRFLNALRLVKISNNLGDAKSLITHPATTTHSRLKPEARAELGISDGMLRLSVGLEFPRRSHGRHRPGAGGGSAGLRCAAKARSTVTPAPRVPDRALAGPGRGPCTALRQGAALRARIRELRDSRISANLRSRAAPG